LVARKLFRQSPADAWLVAMALVHGGLAVAGALVIARAPTVSGLVAAAAFTALGLWWSSNTISHNHLHNPIFEKDALNRGFSLYLSALLVVPQSIWRARHLAHHAGDPPRRNRGGERSEPRRSSPGHVRRGGPSERRIARGAPLELALCAAVVAVLLACAPRLLLFGCAPGYVVGMGLCWLQGWFEHVGPDGAAGVSFYGALYNRLWFNDGFHAEHHRWPREHWSRLPSRRLDAARASGLPPVARWLSSLRTLVNRAQARALCVLERVALASPSLQRFMIATHERAFRALWPRLGAVRRVAVVGGGLFPRTALVVRRIVPDCALVLVDADAGHLAQAAEHLARAGVGDVELRCERFTASTSEPVDLIVLPLGFVGDRARLYGRPVGAPLLVHDWIWRVRGEAGARVSLLLAKRVNLVRG
jgi:fatty acid desaturase